MKTRKSNTVTELKCKDNNINKTKVKKLVKSKELCSENSYRDMHNIGRRKSTNSVITYSLNSHLFFDIYTKFDNNNGILQKSTENVSSKSNRTSPCKLSKKIEALRSSVSVDLSKDAVTEYHSSKSSPKSLKIIKDNQLSIKGDASVPLSPLNVSHSFKSPSQSDVSSPRKNILESKFHDNDLDLSIKNTETFQNGLTNKTMFRKQTLKKCAKIKLKSKIKPRVSERLSKNQTKTTNNNIKPKNIFNNKSLINNKSKNNIDCLLNILTNQSGDKITKSETFNGIKKLEIDEEEGNIELEVVFANDNHNNNITDKDNDKNDFKDEMKEFENDKLCKVKDVEEIVLLPFNDENRKLKDEKKTVLSSDIISKKKSKNSLNCFFDITTTGSQRECEKNVAKSVSIAESSTRPRDTVDHKDHGRIAFKNGCNLKKGILFIKKEIETQKIPFEEDNNTETLWLWHGESQERTIQLQLDGPVVTKTCYPAIKHAKDDVVIQVMDCVMLKSGDEDPYLAKITAFFDDEESGKKMMAVLWYYRPEHTDPGRLLWHSEVDVYASKHLDTNSVDCIEDKAFVLPIELYCRFMSYQRRTGSTSRQGLTSRLVPVMVDDEPISAESTESSMAVFASSFYYGPQMQTSFSGDITSSSNVFVCRGLYDIVHHAVVGDLVPLVCSSLLPSCSLVPGPPERCASVDSAMSISSCDSSIMSTHTTPLSVTLVSKYRHHTLSSSSSSSSSCSPHSSSVTAVLPPLHGRHIPYHRNGH